MKKYFKYILITIASCLVGCAQLQEFFSKIDENQLNVITSAVTVSVSIGVKEACKAGGDKAVLAFKSTSEVITLAINANSYEPVLLKSFISEKLGSDSEYLPIVNAALNTAIAAYQVFYSTNWKDSIESQTVMCKFLTAIKVGIDAGVSGINISSAYGITKPIQDFTAAELTVIK